MLVRKRTAFFGRCFRIRGVMRSYPGAFLLTSLRIAEVTSVGLKGAGGGDKGRGVSS